MDLGTKTAEIYFAGGCFWGMEKLFSVVPGVTDASSGYANGHVPEPTYKMVCSGTTGHKETVQVRYDPERVSLEALIWLFFSVIDTTVENRQGNDIGEQYQTGIFYTSDRDKKLVERAAEIERGRRKAFHVLIEPLTSFYEAEPEHQDYLDKNPSGYCHLSAADFERAKRLKVDPKGYMRPEDGALRGRLTPIQYAVTQQGATERPFEGSYWDLDAKGLYVDAATGEPLFSSREKYHSACGWPAFAEPLDENAVVFREDRSIGRVRTEVRSRAGDSHLGHVFEGDSESPTGVRYCINSAALRFIPYDRMDEMGYGYLKDQI